MIWGYHYFRKHPNSGCKIFAQCRFSCEKWHWKLLLQKRSTTAVRCWKRSQKMARRNGQTGYTGTKLSSRRNPSDSTHRRIAIQIIEVWSWFSSFWPCLISSSVCHDLTLLRQARYRRAMARFEQGKLVPGLEELVPKVRRGVLLLFSVVDSGRLWSPHGPNFEFPGCQKGSERLACRFKCASQWHESQHFPGKIDC